MDWIPGAVLVALAAAFSVVGSVFVMGSGGRRATGAAPDGEAGGNRDILILVLLGVAVALGTVGGWLLAAGRTWDVQFAAFLTAGVAVSLPVAGALLIRARWQIGRAGRGPFWHSSTRRRGIAAGGGVPDGSRPGAVSQED